MILSVTTCLFFASAYSQRLTKEQKEILELQDGRSLGNGKLVSYLRSNDKNLRYQAVIALANIQDTTTVDSLSPLLTDQDVQVRGAVAFALGQIGSAKAQKALVAALTPDQDLPVLGRICEALGKCGDAEGLNSVIAYIPSAKNIAVKRDQAMAAGRFAIRGIKSERAVWLCFDLLKDNHAETRWAALYALWRSAPFGVVDLELSKRAYILQKLISDENEDVRINLAVLLGRSKSREAVSLLRLFQESESATPDWRVQVQISRSAAALSAQDPDLLDVVVRSLSSKNDNVRIASLAALATIDTNVVNRSPSRDQLLEELQHLTLTPSRSAVIAQGEAAIALQRLFPASFAELRAAVEKELTGSILRTKFIEALSYHPVKENLDFVIARLNDDSLRIAMAAWDFLKRMIQPHTLESYSIDTSFIHGLPARLVQAMHPALNRRDMAMSTLVANMFADSSVFALCAQAGYGREIGAAFAASYSLFSSSTDAEAMEAVQEAFIRMRDSASVPVLEKSLDDQNRTVALGAARALRSITGNDYSTVDRPTPTNGRTESDWKMLEAIRPAQRVSFKTTKGTFTVRLRKGDAPFTVLAFYKLVKQKFYDGLLFHRVVPDFVIQGGDPRGDGWGGPGFTLRSEWSMVNFEGGSVGMASSGKDTEGSQFFVTHVPTPHLDGRYTVFATVVSGMEVVDKIQVGDRILKAELK
ncbi:MAG TPA: peptidylprolyl isomerase [Bacteroidota bacterium]